LSAKIIPVAPFDYIVFGGTGDLTLRKLMPALYYRFRDGQMPPESKVIGVSRKAITNAGYVELVTEACRQHVAPEDLDPDLFSRFSACIAHVTLDVTGELGWEELGGLLENMPGRPRVFYLATSPELFGTICRGIGRAGLATPDARVVLEKPVGHSLASARRIHDEVGEVFSEAQIFRIDHYLGKESVQNLLALRFANSILEPVWNRAHIDNVQITVAEQVGVEGRGPYYDRSGALRDMVQNHILQLLCLVAMEPPLSMDAQAIRDEKIKVLRALRPLDDGEALRRTVRGQYREGAVDGKIVPAYREEAGDPASLTETFVALKAEVDNWRWSGVPFYLRTGKRLPSRVSEIIIEFRSVPHSIFGASVGRIQPNCMVVRLQPDDGIKLLVMAKDPGPGGMRLRTAPLNITFADAFKVRYPDAYERLLMDVVRGNATLFMRRDEVEAAWGWVEPILQSWSLAEEPPKPYPAGTWGPTAATALIERDGRTWYEETL
jgi:glucose-6-phosphate 1-dehydrogenase